MIEYELFIQHGNALYYPPILDGVSLELERKGQPGKLTFEIIQTDALNFEEGDPCRFSVDGEPIFYGFIFDKSRQGSSAEKIKITAYDQLYYLKNKDTYVYTNKTASEVVKMLADDFKLNVGSISDTGYKIASRTEENTDLFSIIQNALDETVKATTEMYVLYDAAGKLMLKNVSEMQLGLVIDKDTAGDFDYSTSISSDTYNRIKLVHEDEDSGARKVYIAQDSSNINKWGVLQYYEKLNAPTGAQAMADALLSLHNRKSRKLTVKNVLGDVRVRGGTMLVVVLDLGDMAISNFMLVEQVKHTFKDNEHLMELRLRGNDFVT